MEKTKKAAGAGSEEEHSCSRKFGKWRCKNASVANEFRYCEEHYKDLEMETKKKLPPDEQRCSEANGHGWRCKNCRMGLGEDENGIFKSKLCEKHYNLRAQYKLKKRSGDGEGATGPIEYRGKVTEEDDNRSLDVTAATSHIEGGSANVGTKKELPPDAQRCGRTGFRGWRCKNFRMGHGAAADDANVPKSRYCEKHYILRAKNYENLKKRSTYGEGGGSAKTGAKKKKIETISEKLESSTGINEPVAELEGLDCYKTECFQVSVELELAKKELELAKMKLELEMKTAARDEDTTEYWRNKCSDLETLVLALEIEYLTMRYEDSTILRCEELRNSEKFECEKARGLQNEITQTGDNVEEWEDLDCLEETPCQAHVLEMSKETLENLVSDSGGDNLCEPEDSSGFVDSEISLREPMDTQADRNEVELDWESFIGSPFSYTFSLD